MQQVEPAGPAAPEPALKIVVIDDDPTGSQTVHGCPLLLRWDAASLAQGLRQPSPLRMQYLPLMRHVPSASQSLRLIEHQSPLVPLS